MKTLSCLERITIRASALAILFATLAGCMSLSGFDASNSFSCKAPDGVLCESMSGIYANAQQNNLPGQSVKHSNDFSASAEAVQGKENLVLTMPLSSGTPIRSAPRVLRIWLAPWEDSDGDLHDQSYLYLTVDAGHWLVEYQQRRIQDSFKPVAAAGNPEIIPAEVSEAKFPLVTQPEQASTAIGAVQGKPTEQDAAAMMRDIQTPGQPGQQ